MGAQKRAELRQEVDDPTLPIHYEEIMPELELGYPFMPRLTREGYLDWPRLPDLFPTNFPGVQSKRDEFVVDIDRDRLAARVEKYFDPTIAHEEIARLIPRAMDTTNRDYDAIETREYLLRRGYIAENIVRYCYRAFDYRWIYYEQETNLLQRRSPDYFPHVHSSNMWIEARRREATDEFSRGTLVRALADNFGNGFSNFFPLYLYQEPEPGNMFGRQVAGFVPNLSDRAQAYLDDIGADEKALFYHTLAVLHATAYREENAGALRQDFPRVPLPGSLAALLASAQLGEQVAALLDVETPVPSVTAGDPRDDVADIAILTSPDGPPDFKVTAGWGRLQGGAVMPGRGSVHEDGKSVDVFLNDSTYWKNLPVSVWEYTLGGYQVLKKWLSYRETAVLGRELRPDEAREFMVIARRIAALLALDEALNENYHRVV